MNEMNSSTEAAVREAAAKFQYPATPDIAAGVRQRLADARSDTRPTAWWQSRRLAYAALLLVLLAALLAVPPVRATLVSIIRAGAVNIFLSQPTATPAASGPAVALTPLAEEMANIAEPVTLAQAQEQFRPLLQLPAALDEPDEVWLHQGQEFNVVIFFWQDRERPGEISYSLYQIDAGRYASKGAQILERTTVSGNKAFWVEGPHLFFPQDSNLEWRLFVEGSVLLWWDGAVTYRLEGAASLEEAIRIAESLQPLTEER